MGGQGAKMRIPSLREDIEDIVQTLELIKIGKSEIEVGSKLYEVIDDFVQTLVNVNTKYKTVDKKVKPAAVPLSLDAREMLKKAKEEPRLHDPKKIGHMFTEETLAQIKVGGDGLLTKVEH